MNYLDEKFRLKVGLAEMLKGGVIMDVTNAEQAVIAEKAGACAVMAFCMSTRIFAVGREPLAFRSSSKLSSAFCS